jgi:hypothetical protein
MDTNDLLKSNFSVVTDGGDNQLTLIVETKTLASNLRAAADEQHYLRNIKGSDELILKLEEIFTEIEEQSKKLIATIRTSKTVYHNLQSLYNSMLEVKLYFEELTKSKVLFISKNRHKRKVQLLYQTLRNKCTQLMTSVSLELLTLKTTPVEKPPPPTTSSELYNIGISFYYGIGGRPKNCTMAFEKFIQAAEQDNVDAMVFVSKCYCNGEGVDVNYEAGNDWLETACNIDANDAYPHAKYEVASLILKELKSKNKNAHHHGFAQ